MIDETFLKISKIIEREKKTSTYKFALIRGTIDIVLDNSPYIVFNKNLVEIPLGLLIEKWLIYYYPFFESEVKIPQIIGEKTKIKFHHLFLPIIKYYKKNNSLSGFYSDLRNRGICSELNLDFYKLIKELKSNITRNPMKYLGSSISKEFYSIYSYQNVSHISNSNIQNSNWLINNCGVFTIPISYYNTFQVIGSYISGMDNILFKWAEFSVNASNKKLKTEKILSEILKSPITEREIESSKKLYKSILKINGEIKCVWTGKKVISYDVDHLIPFSVWKNNDLWNLLPAHPTINNNKSDKIPNVETLIKQRDLIIYYWEIIFAAQPDRFKNELKVSLLGDNKYDNWQKKAFSQLSETCKYLIDIRGFEQWNI
jgi:CRISPR/Cas system Type II protein with McrA/HNH and RuvC-like nuclease domain